MNYIPPHLRTAASTLEEPKKNFTETCGDIKVTTNSPYGVLETLKNLKIAKSLPYCEPTVVQKYAIPAVLKSHPLQCRAPTGMGKTMCFLIPLIENLKFGLGPRICIISPTRELCEQIKEEGLKLKPDLSIACLYGGATNNYAVSKASVIVAAPGKLLYFLKFKRIDFNQLTGFVLDEADKLLEMGFEEEIRSIKTFVPAQTPVFLFSATFPKNLNSIINDFLPKNKVSIEIQNETLTNIKQVLVRVKDKDEKLKESLKDIYKERDAQKILVFAEKKVTVQSLENKINSWGFSCVSLHGDKEQIDRQAALNQYKSGKVPILVATSVAARGIDVKDIVMVINYDFPRDIKEYIHRIGRTGRQGKDGVALTFIDNSDLSNISMISELIEVLKESKSEIPTFLTSEQSRKDSNGAGNRSWKSGSSTRKYESRFDHSDIKGLQTNMRKMTINQDSDAVNDKMISSEQNSYLSTEKEDTEEDMAGEW